MAVTSILCVVLCSHIQLVTQTACWQSSRLTSAKPAVLSGCFVMYGSTHETFIWITLKARRPAMKWCLFWIIGLNLIFSSCADVSLLDFFESQLVLGRVDWKIHKHAMKMSFVSSSSFSVLFYFILFLDAWKMNGKMVQLLKFTWDFQCWSFWNYLNVIWVRHFADSNTNQGPHKEKQCYTISGYN